MKTKSMLPTSDEAISIANLYSRRLTTPWSVKEVKVFRQLKPAMVMEDLELLARYYEAERAKGKEGIFRRDLMTLLNNFNGEIDRARQWERGKKRNSANLNGHAKPPSLPPGFDTWFATQYPENRFDDASPHIKDELVREFKRTTK